MAVTALDLAERLQTPVFVLSDLDIGMNLWITKEFQYPEKPLDRGKVLDADLVISATGGNSRKAASTTPAMMVRPNQTSRLMNVSCWGSPDTHQAWQCPRP